MILFYFPGACSFAPHIILNEGKYDFKLEKVDLQTKKTESGRDFKAVNPKGYVPALELEDGRILTEVPAIMQYLADSRPDSKLMPPVGDYDRYKVQEWLNFISSEIHKQYGLLFRPDTPEEQKKISVENIGRRLHWVAKMLEGKNYLVGEAFTVADAYLFTVNQWARVMNIDLSRWPALTQYQARIAERPSVRRALAEEGLAK